MRPQNYDIIIGHKINAFNITTIFKNNGSNLDKLTIHQQVNGQLYDMEVTGIVWHYDTFDSYDTLILKGDLSEKGLIVFKQGLPAEKLPASFFTVNISIACLIANKADWFKLSTHLQIESALLKDFIAAALNETIRKAASNLKNCFFKGGNPFSCVKSVQITQTDFFVVPNYAYPEAAYLCMGQMLDNRQSPEKATFPATELKERPNFIIYFAPYAYLKLGIYANITKAYPNQKFTFSETGNDFFLDNSYIPMNREEIAGKLEIAPHDVLRADIRRLVFSLRNEYLSAVYGAQMHIHQYAKIWILPLPVDDSYEVILDAGSFYDLIVQNEHKLAVVEQVNKRFSHYEKHADNPAVDQIIGVVKEALEQTVIIFIKYVLPIGLDIGLGMNPIAACFLFAVCDTLGDLLSEAATAAEIKAQIRSDTQLRSLQTSFAALMPFNMNEITIKKLYVNEGVIISGN